MNDHIASISTVIEYVIEIHVGLVDGKQQVRLAVGEEPGRAMRLFESLRAAHPVYAGGERHDGWMNLIGVTARSPESSGTLIDQHQWGDEE